MKKTKIECVDEARKSLNLFTGDELHEYITKVNSESRKLQEQGIPFPRNEAIKAINNEKLSSLIDDAATAARDIGKWDIINNKIDSLEVGQQAFLEKTKKNTDYNAETAINAVNQLLHSKSFGELSKEDIVILDDAKIDDAIYEVMDGKIHHDSLANKIGKTALNYIEHRNSTLIQSDAMALSDMSKDRFMKNTYDQSKLNKIGRDAWVQAHKSRIDIEGTFANTRAMDIDGKIDESIVDEMIGNTFDNIISGNGPLFTRASVSRDKQMIERSRHMFYKYKDWKSWGMSNKEYGQETLFKSWLMDINNSSHQAGMSEIFGSSPQQMYLEMRHKIVSKEENTIKNSLKHQVSDALFNNLLGASKGAFNTNIANIGSSIRAATSTARLGGIALLSISDTANIAGMAQRAGAGYWGPYINGIVNLFDRLPSESRKVLARTMSSVIQVHSGTVSRFSDISGMGTMVNRMSNKFFHGIGLHALDRGNKLSAMEPIMKTYGKVSSKSKDVLHGQQQAYLNRFNITNHEWDSLRSKTKDGYFTTDNVDRLDDGDIRELWNKSDKLVPLTNYRSNLYRKVFSMFDTAHEFSVLQPTSYTNMITTGNFKPGHIGGEIWRMFGQFKAYPIQNFRRVWVGGMQDFDSYQGKAMYALNQSLGTIMLAGLAESLVAISKGLTPPDPTKMSKSEQAKYYGKLLAGGLGIFNVIFGEGNAAKNAAGAFFGTPSVKFIYDPLVTAVHVGTGDFKGAKKSVREFANVANPIATVPIISPFIDGFLGNKPYIEPGQKQLF